MSKSLGQGQAVVLLYLLKGSGTVEVCAASLAGCASLINVTICGFVRHSLHLNICLNALTCYYSSCVCVFSVLTVYPDLKITSEETVDSLSSQMFCSSLILCPQQTTTSACK